MLLKMFLYLAVLVGSGVAAARIPIAYKYDDLRDYIGLLSGVSGMVFTIMGIWIAFIYPNALSRLVNASKIVNADFSDTLEDTKRLENIVAAVLKSALVACGLILIVLTKVAIWKTSFYAEYASLIKAGAFSVVVLATVVQIEAIASVIFANVMFINDLHRKRQDREADQGL